MCGDGDDEPAEDESEQGSGLEWNVGDVVDEEEAEPGGFGRGRKPLEEVADVGESLWAE
jgi:hypothetical protein